ncbi:MAG: hypothetical protein IPH05_02600 [Flavobacteriales bacterium]|jgi:tetratricopeptide (TPR) repeat protein|nr:hypothetical protein [Flavobacteriales bacterium]MBK6881838.1 hypothetical protein [Flavobacteriales bacterium]MBK7113243.1 hypothetical protein [Flavobacteriales bacterium]MBK7482756.1 hypothetical protein [Flavobacteriales bacterium]MBK7619485.1 hypothetical protein [Flavobacteriales bacterium]
MPTRTHDRFTPHGSLTRDQLLAYAEGRLNATEQHQVELHLEADPLLREAMEGLRMPGAAAALAHLAQERPTPKGINAGSWLVGGAVAVAIVAVLWWQLNDREEPLAEVGPRVEHKPASVPSGSTEIVPLAFTEIDTATEIAEILRIGHAATDRHAQASEATVERIMVERIGARPITVDQQTETPAADPRPAHNMALHWIYLHDLKVADPKDLYAAEPLLISEPEHVPARFADGQQRTAAMAEQRQMRYTPFMEEALSKFVRNDHKGCLEDLRFLMGQYPDDVNALFYAGLCCYNLGMNERAKEFLQRAATHPVSLFDEEATWYHALSLERLGDGDQARIEFARIAKAGGYYAERASNHASQH